MEVDLGGGIEIDEGFVACCQFPYVASYSVLYKYSEDRWDKQHPLVISSLATLQCSTNGSESILELIMLKPYKDTAGLFNACQLTPEPRCHSSNEMEK